MAKKRPKKKKGGASGGGPQAQSRRRTGRKGGRSRYLILGLLAAGLLGGAALYYFAAGGKPGQRIPDLGNRHIPPGTDRAIRYNSDPPTSGPHYGGIARWGVHEAPIPKGLQVHNLEDGGVLVQYSCSGCPELVQKLQTIVARYRHVILAPYPGMKQRIALTAWGRIDTLDAFDEKRIVRFIEAYEGIDHHVQSLR